MFEPDGLILKFERGLLTTGILPLVDSVAMKGNMLINNREVKVQH
jgi:hypothetical protein